LGCWSLETRVLQIAVFVVDSQAAEPSAPPEELIEDATKEETSVDTPTTVGSEQDGEMSSSAGIYCNQVASYHTGSSNKLPSPAAFSPDADPRNNPAFGKLYYESKYF